MSDYLISDISNSELAKIAHVAAILLRDGNCDSNRALVSQLQHGVDLDLVAPATDKKSLSSFAAIDRDVYLRHSAYVHRDRRVDFDDELRRHTVRAGLSDQSLPPDHLAQEMFVVATMLAKDHVDEATQFARDFVALWITPVSAVVFRESDATDRVAIELCLSVLEELSAGVESSDRTKTALDVGAPTALDWHGLTRRLPYPDLAGMFITRTQLSNLARGLNIPVGFGSRERMVELLIEGAVRYEMTDELKQLMLALFDRDAEYFRLVNRRLEGYGFGERWLADLEETVRLIESID